MASLTSLRSKNCVPPKSWYGMPFARSSSSKMRACPLLR